MLYNGSPYCTAMASKETRKETLKARCGADCWTAVSFVLCPVDGQYCTDGVQNTKDDRHPSWPGGPGGQVGPKRDQ